MSFSRENFDFYRFFFAENLSFDPNHSTFSMAASRSCTLRFMILFSIASFLYQSCYSFLSPPSSIINPSKVKQVSWKPRFQFSLHFATSFSRNFILISVEISFSFCFKKIFLFFCRAFVYEGFLTDLECDHLISLVSCISTSIDCFRT